MSSLLPKADPGMIGRAPAMTSGWSPPFLKIAAALVGVAETRASDIKPQPPFIKGVKAASNGRAVSAKWWVGDWGEGRSLKLKIVGVQESTAFGQELATYQFKDTDGVEVIASLYADQDGNPFELDVWKVDFTPVMRLPE